jgi:hypothetical protein
MASLSPCVIGDLPLNFRQSLEKFQPTSRASLLCPPVPRSSLSDRRTVIVVNAEILPAMADQEVCYRVIRPSDFCTMVKECVAATKLTHAFILRLLVGVQRRRKRRYVQASTDAV